MKIGDKVKTDRGITGSIVAIDGACYGMEFDSPEYGIHSCDGKGKEGRCMWVMVKGLTLVKKKVETARDLVMF